MFQSLFHIFHLVSLLVIRKSFFVFLRLTTDYLLLTKKPLLNMSFSRNSGRCRQMPKIIWIVAFVEHTRQFILFFTNLVNCRCLRINFSLKKKSLIKRNKKTYSVKYRSQYIYIYIHRFVFISLKILVL